jgi:hypothetical protein
MAYFIIKILMLAIVVGVVVAVIKYFNNEDE